MHPQYCQKGMSHAVTWWLINGSTQTSDWNNTKQTRSLMKLCLLISAFLSNHAYEVLYLNMNLVVLIMPYFKFWHITTLHSLPPTLAVCLFCYKGKGVRSVLSNFLRHHYFTLHPVFSFSFSPLLIKGLFHRPWKMLLFLLISLAALNALPRVIWASGSP